MRLLQLVPSVLLIGSSVSAASVFSREPPQVAELSGTIAIVDTVSLRVRPDDGSVMTFVVDDPSSLPLGLVAGTRVTVRYETREGGGRRLLSVRLALGSNAPADAAAAALPLESAVSLRASAGVESSLSAREAQAAAAPARPAAPGRCPLQLVALVLLVATGALLVIASWR
jgi:hypothetical protein